MIQRHSVCKLETWVVACRWGLSHALHAALKLVTVFSRCSNFRYLSWQKDIFLKDEMSWLTSMKGGKLDKRSSWALIIMKPYAVDSGEANKPPDQILQCWTKSEREKSPFEGIVLAFRSYNKSIQVVYYRNNGLRRVESHGKGYHYDLDIWKTRNSTTTFHTSLVKLDTEESDLTRQYCSFTSISHLRLYGLSSCPSQPTRWYWSEEICLGEQQNFRCWIYGSE